jgi:hypothetical protein
LYVSKYFVPKVSLTAFQVALEKGKLTYQGGAENFLSSSIMEGLIQTKHQNLDAGEETAAETVIEEVAENLEESKEEGEAIAADASTSAAAAETEKKAKAPRKLVEDEARAVGRIGKSVWVEYVQGAGGAVYWGIFAVALISASLSPVAENGWVK